MDHVSSNQQAITVFSSDGDIDTLFHNIDQLITKGVKSLMIFSADENHYNEARITQKLNQLSVPVFGGIFPQIIYQDQAYQKGCIVCGFYLEIQVTHVTHLSHPDTNLSNQLEPIAQQFTHTKNMMLLVDGNSLHLSRFMENVYFYFGSDVAYFGGGAGTLQLKPSACLYSNAGLLADSAALISMPIDITVSVEHGWEKFAGPFVITESNQNVVQMIDYHPAFDCYKAAIEKNSDHQFDQETFFDIAKYYPFGIENLDGTIIVRDAIKHVDNTLVCVAELPKNSICYILKGTDKHLIASAKKAAKHIQRTNSLMPIMLFNCISLALALENKLPDQLKAITDNLPACAGLIGASTIGEIASAPSGLLVFHNKTTVLAAFQEV